MAQAPVIFNVQRFSTHDGPGIRTTVFFKGCPLRCAWCHNPESQRPEPELLFDACRCTGCGACLAACPDGAIARAADGTVTTDRSRCTTCGACADVCPADAREVAGAPAPPPAELARQLARDRIFFERSGGGVTLSGGECLAQDGAYLEELARILHDEGVHVAADTCGAAPARLIERLIPWVDLWLYDVKAADAATHRALTGAPNEQILENLALLARRGAAVRARVPVIGGANDAPASLAAIAEAIRARAGIVPVSLLPYHAAGNEKYLLLGRASAPAFTVPSAERMEQARALFLERGFTDVEIGG